MKKLINLGCKLNQYEGFCLLKRFSGAGDVVIVNTCCVTREAEVKSLKKYRHAVRNYQGATIVATGCLCRTHPDKFSLAHHVIDNAARNELITGLLPEPARSRYFLKIEDGCDSTCTFCVVKKIRPILQSKPFEEIDREIGWAVSRGYHEIVLVGANIGRYGAECGLSFTALLEHLARVPGLPRVRLSSLEPSFVNENVLTRLRDIPFCRHLHVPVQSADDAVLERMGRDYRAADLENAMDLIGRYFNDVAVGADIIVGFPREDEAAFNRTVAFIDQHAFTHLHVFTYSPRPDTEAYSFGDPVPLPEKRRRSQYLHGLIGEKNYAFRKSLIGRVFDVVLERSGMRCEGLTDNYIRVILDRCSVPAGIVRTQITGVTRDQTTGRAMPE